MEAKGELRRLWKLKEGSKVLRRDGENGRILRRCKEVRRAWSTKDIK